MKLEEIYKGLYTKYAPNLSQEELDKKLEYASTLDPSDFINGFYQKYTGQGPNQKQIDYMNSMLKQPEVTASNTELPKNKINEALDVNGKPIKFKKDEDGRRMYFSKPDVGGESRYLREVGYEYDRSKGIRLEVDSWGKYIDNIAYSVIGKTIQSFQSGTPGELSEEAINIMMMDEKKRGKMTTEQAVPIINAMKLAEQTPKSEAMQKWIKTVDEAKNPVYGFVKAMGEHGAEVSYEAMISSMAGQAKAFWESPEIRTAAITAGVAQSKFGGLNPYLRAAGFMRGMMSVLGGSVESASTFSELIKEQFGGEIPSEKEFIEFAKNEDLFNKFRNKALKKGLTITAVDNFGGGMIVKSVAKTAKKGKKVAAVTKGVIGEAAVGATGEIAGSAIAGEEIQASAVGLEIIGQGPQAAVDIGAAVVTPGKFKINGDPVTLKQLNKVLETANPDELANMNIQIEGNQQLEAEVNNKKNDAYLYTQVDERVPDSERSKLVNLEKQRAKAEADTKKKGIFTVPGAKNKLENIENQIAEIINKYAYTAFDPDTRTEVKQRKKVQQKIKQDRVNQLLENLNKKLAEQGKQQLKDVKALADYVQKRTGKVFNVEEGDSVEMEQHLKRVQGREKLNKGESQRFGSMTPVMDDAGNVTSYELFINKETAYTANGDLNVAAHEFFHGAIFATLQGNIEAQMTLGNALISALKSKNAKLRKDSDLNERIAAYEENEGQGEEILTLVGSALLNNEIEINEGFMQDLRDVWRRFGQKYLGREIRFDTDQDVLNFIKDFNKTVKDPSKINESMLNAISEGIQGKLLEDIDVTKGPKVGDTTFSKEASDNVQRIYDEQGEAGAMDIIDAFKPITSKLVERRSQAPNFDRQLLTDEIETGQRGIFDLIREYKPDSGVPLAAYINKFLPARAIEASKRVLGEEFTEDVTEAKTIAAEEVATETKVKRKPKKIVLADRLGITDKVSKAINKIVPDLDIDKLTFKTLKNKIPNITGELFGIAPKKIESLANLTKKELQSAQMFINKNADLLINMLPEGATASGTATGVPNTLLKAFYTKTDRAKMAKTGTKAGLAIQQKNNINKTDFLETFGIIDGKPDRTDRNTSARVLALANLTGKMITNQAVRGELAKLKANDKAINKIAEGKSKTMFSKDAKKFNIDGTIDDLLGVHAEKVGRKTFKLRTEEDVDLYIEALINDVLPLMPRQFWFGKEEGVSDTGSEFTPSDRVIDIPKTRKQERKDLYVYYKQQINALNQLPDDAFGKGVGVTDFSRPSYGSLFEGKKGVQVDKIKETNKRTAKIHEALWSRIYDTIQKNPSKAATIGNYFKLVSKQNNHWHRAAAEIIGYSTKPKGTAKKLYEYEHAMPASASYLYLIDGALKGYDFKSIYNPVMDNFKLIALDAAENKKLNDAGLADKMPEGWNTTDNKWWERYFNDKVDIDSESIITLDGKTFKEEFNIVQLKTDLKDNIKLSKAVNKNRTMSSKPARGITVLDFDDTLATTKSLVKYTRPDGTTGTLNAEEFANTYESLQDQGYVFDFSDFNKVVKGKLAPLFNKAMKLQGKFGPENMFVLTARPPAAQKAIFDFLKANGLNIPLKNITGLGNSTSEAKALWIADKVGEGYNDFYFADDALQNVQAVKNMLDQFDVKSKVQQARTMFSKNMNDQFNDILEEVTGIDSKKRFSDIKARKRGASKGKFRFFIPPSHEDFVGLLYNFMGKGRRGDQHRNFFEQALIRPLNRAYRELNTAKQSIANDYKSLNKQFPNVKKKLTKKTPDGDFTFEDAIRVYLFDKHGHDITGLSETDQKNLVDIVMKDPELRSYAETLNTISKQEAYVSPTESWDAGNIRTDLDDATGRIGREEFFTEFFENTDVIFSPKNMNKIEAAYGAGMVSALKDILYRTKTGRNRPSGQNKMVNQFMNYLNGSVGATMFFNIRSSVLQQMSLVNFINFADNNVLAASKAFANQKQYWKDWAMLFNSDFMKQRRGGIKTDVNGAELAASVKDAKNPAQAVIKKLLEIGFLPTQIGDNIAIATGGATFLRNRINTYLKQGLSKKDAESKAFVDFQVLAEATQQSARPDMVSQQQASPLGKIILAFQNVTSQFNRLGKKAFLDLKNRRISPEYKNASNPQFQSDIGNVSRIAYYFAIQNLVFYALQSALFAAMFDDDEDDERFLKKKERMISGSIDSVLRGAGVWGAAVATLKNMAIKWHEQREKGYNADESAVLMEMLNVSPPLGIKARKLVNAEKTLNYNTKVIKEMETFDIDNPQWSAVTNYVEATTNVPLNRLYNKTINVRDALDSQHSAMERALMFAGWSKWNLGIPNEKIEKIKKKQKFGTKKKKKKSKTFKILK